MTAQKNWSDIVSQIQRSGLQQQKQLQQNSQKRYLYLQKDLLNQIIQTSNRKKQIRKQQQIQRIEAQQGDRKSQQKQQKIKQKIRQKQQKMRIQNLKLMKQKQILINLPDKQKILQYTQNPITIKLHDNSSERKYNSRKSNQQYDKINKDLILEKNQENIKQKQKNNKEGLEFKNYVEQSFKKIDQQRYKFKKGCLEGRHKTVQKSQLFQNQPDSLQKQYSAYLQQQISEKNKLASRNKTHIDDRINDINILKINQDVQKQSPSPAYLGRITNSHDRQKQLNYLDNQIYKNRRLKTQAQLVQIHSKTPNIEQNHKIDDGKEKLGKRQSAFNSYYSPYMKKVQKPRVQVMRQFKQYNILTGQSIVRNQYTTQVQ